MASNLSETFAQVFIAETFKCFNDFEEKFKAFQQETGSVYRVKSSTSVEFENKRRKKPLPACLKYSNVVFVCVHYGVPKKSGVGVRMKQRYLPCGCESSISLTARNDCLVINNKMLSHNHEVNQELQQFYGQRRRLTTGQLAEVEDVIRMNPGNKQLKSFLQSKFNKVVTLQDIRNLKHKVKSSGGLTDSEELYEVVKDMEGKGKIEVLIDDDGVIQMISFATKEMLSLYGQFPELILMDGTYKVNKYNYPLYIILIQDNLGRGRAVFYAFVRSETGDMMRAILSSFKNMCQDTSKTCTVMLDKDQNEIDAIRNALPAASVLLCHFHVLKYFKKKVSELLLPVDEKNELFAQLKALVYAKDAEAFDSMMTKLAEMNEELHQYISKNWQNCKQMWVAYLRQGTITFGNDTNNRIESENSKLKHLMCASSSMSECIRQLCFHNAILDDERQYQQFLSKYTTVQYGNKDEDLSPLYSQFTEHAVKKMLKNHVFPHMPSVSNISPGNFEVNLGKSDQSVSHEGNNYICTCQFHSQNKLPCRHIIATVRYQGKDISVLAENSRWLKKNTALPQSISSLSGSQLSRSPKPQRPMTTVQRYRNAQETIQRLTATLTNCGSSVHQERLSLLKEIVTCWEQNGNTTVHCTIPHAPARVDAGDLVSSDEICGIVPEKTQATSQDNDTLDGTAPTFQSVSEQMKAVSAHLPIVKCRGRPKQSRTLGGFNNTQRKRKASVPVGSRFSKKAAKLQEANISEEETVDDPSMITEDICYICTREDPPREVSREPLTEWTDCAKDCGRWFHTACIRHSGDSVQGYICNTC